MKPFRFSLLPTAILALGMFTALAAHADYPDREITMVVPFGAGGSTDVVGRIAASALSESLGVPVIVDNRGGAGGTIGTQAATRLDPDGYNITVATTSTHVVGPLTNKTVRYDPVNDFEHIGMIAETPYVMVVSPKLDATSVQDVIDHARKNPGMLNYGSAGQGSTTHLAALMFLDATGVEMEHLPYAGNAEATVAVMGDEVQVLFGSMPAVLPQIKAGTIKALAVGTVKRSPELPEVPTMQEAGVKDYRASLWLGLAAPKNTPREAVDKLSGELRKAIESNPEFVKQLANSGAVATSMSSEDFRALVGSELQTYGKIVSTLN